MITSQRLFALGDRRDGNDDPKLITQDDPGADGVPVAGGLQRAGAGYFTGGDRSASGNRSPRGHAAPGRLRGARRDGGTGCHRKPARAGCPGRRTGRPAPRNAHPWPSAGTYRSVVRAGPGAAAAAAGHGVGADLLPRCDWDAADCPGWRAGHAQLHPRRGERHVFL